MKYKPSLLLLIVLPLFTFAQNPDSVWSRKHYVKKERYTKMHDGVTYKEDKPIVQKSISDLVNSGVYAENLWP